MFNVDNAENLDEWVENRTNEKLRKMIASLDERRIIVTAVPNHVLRL